MHFYPNMLMLKTAFPLLTPEAHWSCRSQTLVARASQKPALPATQPQASARQNQPQPKHLSHKARSSEEIRKIITLINNNSNNKINNKIPLHIKK